MGKTILTSLFSFVFLLQTHAQRDYPIRTIFKGDSVVILTVKQSEAINRTIDKLNKKSDLASTEALQLRKEKDSLLIEMNNLKKEIKEAECKVDSIETLFCEKIDTLQSTIDSIGSWMLNAAVNNSFVYFDWCDTTIKFLDLTLYGSYFNNWTGNFRIVRMGYENEYDLFNYYNWTSKESPDKSWLKVNSIYLRPRVYNYPFEFKFRNKYLVK